MAGIIDSLLPAIDSILGVRDSVGAVMKPVYLVTRTWYTSTAYTTQSTDISGYPKDTEVQMLPSPGVKDFAHDLRLQEGGMIKQGDILLQNVSKNSYSESQLDGRSSSANVEKLYRVGDNLYQVVNVREKYVTWDVLLRRIADQKRYI